MDFEELYNIASNPETPSDTLSDIIKGYEETGDIDNIDGEIFYALAKNPSTPSADLTKLREMVVGLGDNWDPTEPAENILQEINNGWKNKILDFRTNHTDNLISSYNGDPAIDTRDGERAFYYLEELVVSLKNDKTVREILRKSDDAEVRGFIQRMDLAEDIAFETVKGGDRFDREDIPYMVSRVGLIQKDITEFSDMTCHLIGTMGGNDKHGRIKQFYLDLLNKYWMPAIRESIKNNTAVEENYQNAMRKHSLIMYSVIGYTFQEEFKEFNRYDFYDEIPFEKFYCDQEASRIDTCRWSYDSPDLTYNDLVFPVILRCDYTHHPFRSENPNFNEFIHEVYIPDLDLPGKEEFIKKAQEQFGASKVHVYKPEDRINRAEVDKILDNALKYNDILTKKQWWVEDEVQNFIEDFLTADNIDELKINPISINGHLYDIIIKEDTEQAGKMFVLKSTSDTNVSLKLNEREFFILFHDEIDFLNLDELQSFNQEILEMRIRLRDEIVEIRRLDRAAQSVTEAEEKMAEEAMAKMVAPKEYVVSLGSVEVDEGISVDDEREVHTPAIIRVPDDLSHFSPITDKLFGTKEIIIYNSHEFCYYGPEAHYLGQTVMADEVSQGKAYFGGSEQSGYFGTSYDALNVEETIKKTCNCIIGMEEPCFLISEDPNCPEEYKNACKDLLNEIELASDLKDLSDIINESEGMWNHKPYTVTDIVRSESGDIASIKITNGEGQIGEVPVKDNKITFGNNSFDIQTGKVEILTLKKTINTPDMPNMGGGMKR